MSLRAWTRVGLGASAALAAVAAAAVGRPMPSPALLALGSLGLLASLTAVPLVALRWVNPPTSAMMMATRRQRRREGRGRTLEFEWVALEHISREMWLAAVAAEDGYFRDHSGFDWESIREARVHNRTHDRKRGASTITQQVVKNLFLWRTRSYLRKAVEAYGTILIEALWPKRRILEVYLNIAQLGDDVFGVEAAARRYLHKSSRDLTALEASLFAAALPNPVEYRVTDPSHQMRFRQSWILGAMRRLGDQYLEAL